MKDALVSQILHSRQRVLMYEPEHETEAREVMEQVAVELASELAVTDPSLDNLVIVDRYQQIAHWEEVLPTAHVTTVPLLVNHDDVISRHQSIVSLSPEFARRISISGPMRGATRLYLMTPSWKSAIHFSNMDVVLRLEDAA